MRSARELAGVGGRSAAAERTDGGSGGSGNAGADAVSGEGAGASAVSGDGARSGRPSGGRSGRWRRRPGRLVLAAATVVGLAATLSACHPQRWTSQLVSANAAGTDSANARSYRPVLSRDGTKVVFESDASNLGPTDTNGVEDIYVRDLTTGATQLVSVNAAGTDSGNDNSRLASVSPDGTKVAFYSDATNLTSLDPGPHTQVYVRDLVAGTTTLVSISADGTTGADDAVDSYGLSPDGSRVVFGSRAGNLAPPFTPGVGTLYERDLAAGVTTRLAVGHTPQYSPSGDALTFVDQQSLYLRDARTGAISLLAGAPAGTQITEGAVFSPDGSKVAFARQNSTGALRTDIYVYDRVARTTTLVTVGVGGGGSNGAPSVIHGFHPTDANRLLFSSTASNLVPNDTNGRQDLFVRNLGRGTTSRVVSDVGGGRDNRSRSVAVWVGDGSRIAFTSGATHFGQTDTNQVADVYVLRLSDGAYELVSESAAGHDAGNGESGVFHPYIGPSPTFHEISASGDGTRIAFGSDAGNLGPTDSDRPSDHDVYVATLGSTGS